MTKTPIKQGPTDRELPGRFELKGKIAVVTGGASGIGVGITNALAEAGATIILADVNSEAIEQQLALMQSAGLRSSGCQLDLADEASIVESCNDILSGHGTPWILVNNAGRQACSTCRQTFSGSSSQMLRYIDIRLWNSHGDSSANASW